MCVFLYCSEVLITSISSGLSVNSFSFNLNSITCELATEPYSPTLNAHSSYKLSVLSIAGNFALSSLLTTAEVPFSLMNP